MKINCPWPLRICLCRVTVKNQISQIRWPSSIEASAPRLVDLSSIPSRVKPMTLKLVLTASLLDVQHLRDSVEKAGKFTCCAVG